jgi:hypothetical protein
MAIAIRSSYKNEVVASLEIVSRVKETFENPTTQLDPEMVCTWFVRG